MLSYKEWKVLNESLLGGFQTLGISTKPSLGIVSNAPTVEEPIEEAKKTAKKGKKKMDIGDEVPAEEEGGEEEETGKKVVAPDKDGEIVKAAAPKDKDVDADAEAEADSEEGEEGEEAEEGEEGEEKLEKKPMDDTGMSKEMMMKKGCKGCKTGKKKMMKKESADEDFWTSIHNMMGVPEQKNWDGWTPIESVEQGIREEPKAGEIGFAPQGKVGSI